ncbi:MAG: hypothetical protein LBQ77_00685 [Treponema sp.]|nr:hypothetical protein [Treponema sp.]
MKRTIIMFAIALSLSSVEAVFAEVSLVIRYFDKRIYYINGPTEEPIYIQLTLTNNSPEVFHFRMANERAFSVDFDVLTMTNRPLEQSHLLMRKRNTSQPVFFREVVLEPGESFSFVEDLRMYSALNQTGSFIVIARMYPALFQNNSSSTSLVSNRLTLNLRAPSLLGPDGVPIELDVETGAILVREALPPDQVIDYMLRARQKEQWEKFFLYLDLEAMMTRDSTRQRQWLAESQEGRQRLLARYRESLRSNTIGEDIVTIPMDFVIERTNYGAVEGTVVVLERFKVGMYTERKRYTYYLRRYDGIWVVTDYQVVHLGTD